MVSISRLFRPPAPVPEIHRANFKNLYFDIAWFGVLNGSTLLFLAVFAARLGASAQQLGMISAAPAVMNLIFTLPTGIWVRRFSTKSATVWAAAISRLFYLFLIPLPSTFSFENQIWIIIAIILAMNIPGTISAMIGNAFIAEAVPAEWRGHVVGTRNALYAATSMAASLACGLILDRMAFPNGYQIVFAIGFAGAAMSWLHLSLVRPVPEAQEPAALKEIGRPEPRGNLRFEILRGPFAPVLGLMFFYHFSVFLGNPVFPLYQVHVLNFTDQVISLGQVLFYIVHFFGSMQTGRLAHRYGNQRLFAVGLMFTSISTTVFLFSHSMWIYALCQLFSGIGWSMVGGSALNYLLERMPASDRPAHLTWYNLAINAAMLSGAFLGAQIAEASTPLAALAIVVLARFAGGWMILRWGSQKSRVEQPEAGGVPS